MCLLAACGDNIKATPQDAGSDATDASALAACLDRPTDLPRPPTGQLPCELLPPGFKAP
jgi:hypothetical protein